jgi:hypothetical protein
VQDARERLPVREHLALAHPGPVDRERARAQRDDAIVVGPLHDERPDERRLGRARQPAVVRPERLEVRRLVGERDVGDRAELVLLQAPAAGEPLDAPRQRAGRHGAVDEGDGIERPLPQPGIGEERLPVDVDDERHVVGQLAPVDVRLAALDGEAGLREQREQHGVDLEAVAPAAAHDTCGQLARVQRRALPELRGERLVGNGPDVRAVQHAQPVEVGARHRGQPDVSQQVHPASMPRAPTRQLDISPVRVSNPAIAVRQPGEPRSGTGPAHREGGTMQYLLLIYGDPTEAPAEAQSQEAMGRWFQYTQDLEASGALRGGNALEFPETATTVRIRGGETLLTDGPFAETKEILGGYYLIDVADLDAALGWAAKMPNIEYGSVEVRPVVVFD